jgi:hypothetical protein
METIYDQGKKAFLIKDGDDELASVPFPFSDKDHLGQDLQMADAADYLFYTYYKKDVRELDYCKANVNTGIGGGAPQRVGWMIPLSVLTTEDPAIQGEQHMNQYAFYAYCHLLGKEEIMAQLVDDNELGDILERLYLDGCLLIICNARMPANVTVKHLELSLARNGYFSTSTGYCNPQISSNQELNLIPASEILKPDGTYVHDYIEDFLQHHVYDANSFIRFLYLYQIEEVLMDMEMVELLKDYLYLLEHNQPNYRKAESAFKDATELKRLEHVVENARLNSGMATELDRKCNAFLNSDPNSLLEQPESIYQVRNHIVHRFRKASGDEPAVKEICDSLELYLYDLLICYKLPKVNRPNP